LKKGQLITKAYWGNENENEDSETEIHTIITNTLVPRNFIVVL
jgi:hypothetical protein